MLVENDPAAFAEAVGRLIGEQDRFQQFKQETLSRAKTFEITRQAEKLVEVYQQAQEAKKAGQFVKVRKEVA